MRVNQAAGIVLVSVGAVLLYFGFQSSESVSEQFIHTFTGRFSEDTMWYFIGGVALAAVGLSLLFIKR